MKKLIVLVMLCIFALTGCLTTKVATQNVSDMTTVSQDFDAVMTKFVDVWPYISGAINGAYEGQTFDMKSGLVEQKKRIDAICKKQDGTFKEGKELSKYEKGQVSTLWASLVTGGVMDIIKKFAPNVLKLIPILPVP